MSYLIIPLVVYRLASLLSLVLQTLALPTKNETYHSSAALSGYASGHISIHTDSVDSTRCPRAQDPPFAFTLTNRSANLTLLQTHLTSTLSLGTKISKRATYPINLCPPGQLFQASSCLRFRSPQAYVLSCYTLTPLGIPPAHSTLAQCDDNQICVDGPDSSNVGSGDYVYINLAYCVDMENFVKIVASQPELKEEGEIVQTWPPVSAPGRMGGSRNRAGASYYVEAVVTGMDGTTALLAESMQIAAQTSRILRGVRSWQAVAGATRRCVDCEAVGMGRVPVETQRVDVDVVLKAEEIRSGMLYLATVAV